MTTTGHIICEGDRVAMDVFSEVRRGGRHRRRPAYQLVTRTRTGTVSAVGTFHDETHEFVLQGGGGVITEGPAG